MNELIAFETPRVLGLSNYDQNVFSKLVETLQVKRPRNKKRVDYYNAKNKLDNLNISIPQHLEYIESVVGWPAKAVDALADRSIFNGFVSEEFDLSEINKVFDDNQFSTMYSQGVLSELIHSCSFITLSKGAKDEPAVLMSCYSAERAAALWDYRKKRIKAGITLVSLDEDGKPNRYNLYTDTAIIEIFTRDGQKWQAVSHEHSQKRPLMEPLVYRPTLDRPFGRSRISRPVMSITDSAVRASLRGEISAELFSAPQRYLLGAREDLFGSDKARWDAYIGSIFAISRDEDGEIPTYGQLSAASMQPHTDYMRGLAARFSGETSIPVSSLGIVHDNPSSAEAIYAAREDLVIEAQKLNHTNGIALKNIARMVVAIMADKSVNELTEEERSITPRFKQPDQPSIVSQSDALVKIVAAIPWVADSEVALEMLGLDEGQIARLKEDKKRESARMALDETLATLSSNATAGGAEYDDD